MSWEKPSDIDLLKDLLERADIDYDIHEADKLLDDDKQFLETNSGVYFTFNSKGELEEVANG